MSVSRHTSELERIAEASTGGVLRMESAYRFEHGYSSPWHTHLLGHLVIAASGVLSLITDDGTWIAPGNRFAWVPAGFEHSHRAHGDTDTRILHVSPELAAELPAAPAVLVATPLAREAALAVTSGEARSTEALAHLRRVIVDEAVAAPEQPLHLPEPRDPRLRAVVDEVARDLATPVSLDELARRIASGTAVTPLGGAPEPAAKPAASARTLSRLFRDETGLGYRQWRTQLRVHRALVLLAGGATVTETAAACGWASTSQFIEQFTPLVGMTPGRFRSAD